ncbi:hypothetical protein [Pseudomonas palmensis]|uniref:hypothetical protein n=1 Tax=Pseudomonas palmensis TaxID=2815362 RepID=UPI0039EAFEFA
MAKKQGESAEGLMYIIGFVALLPLMVVSISHYYSLKSRYPEDEDTQRIFDVRLVTKYFVLAGIIGFVVWNIAAKQFVVFTSSTPIYAAIVIGAVYLLVKLAMAISANYFGVLVDPQNDRVILPKDMANYSITDYLGLKFIRELGQVEEVRLSQVKRITRQGGIALFIHGKFGSRGIKFSIKQKRDECLSAIQDASKSRTVVEYESA